MPRPGIIVASLVVLLLTLSVSGSDISFSGTLDRAGKTSISIRLADRRLVDAMLPNPSRISAQYDVGDDVEITCKSIEPVLERATGRYQSLEVVGLRVIGRGAAEVLPKKSEVPRPPVADATLEHARRVNLDYVAHMPNFVADETARRYRRGSPTARWRDYDTVESEITFQGNRAVRRQMRRNGMPWEQPFEALPGFKWYEGFATEIKPIFDPQCPTSIENKGRSKLAGRDVTEYQFSSPADGCFPFFYFDYQRYNPARTGHFFVDEPGGNLIQIDEEARHFPADFEFAEREEHIYWDTVKIGAESHLLPVRARFLVRYHAGNAYRVEVEYRNHRHFESSTNVTFQ